MKHQIFVPTIKHTFLHMCDSLKNHKCCYLNIFFCIIYFVLYSFPVHIVGRQGPDTAVRWCIHTLLLCCFRITNCFKIPTIFIAAPKLSHFFTELALRLIQSIGSDVRGFVLSPSIQRLWTST